MIINLNNISPKRFDFNCVIDNYDCFYNAKSNLFYMCSHTFYHHLLDRNGNSKRIKMVQCVQFEVLDNHVNFNISSGLLSRIPFNVLQKCIYYGKFKDLT